MKKSTISCLVALTLLGSIANAETFSGTVTARRSVDVYAPIGGVVSEVPVRVGQTIGEDETIAVLDVTEVYASEAGTITGIFGEPGDNAETISSKYGAVMYIEGESVYTISASTDNAYNTTSNKFVHVGESVYLSCYSDGKHTGTGIITAIEGTDYTVEVTSGSFLVPETVNIYRGSSATATQRIGRGSLTRNTTTSVTGSGSIVEICVENGQQVEKGQLLMTTLTGDFDGLYMTGNEITGGVAGTVATLNVSQGSKIEKGDIAAVIYPAGEMCVEAEVSEYDLEGIAVGDKMNIELLWNQDSNVSYEGVVTMISAVATEAQATSADSESETTFTVYVDFTPDAFTRYGMSAVISKVEDDDVEDIEDLEDGDVEAPAESN